MSLSEGFGGEDCQLFPSPDTQLLISIILKNSMVKHVWAKQNQPRLNRFTLQERNGMLPNFFFFFAKHLMGFVS